MASVPAPSCDSLYCSSSCCKYNITNGGLTSENYSYTSCTDNSYVTSILSPSQTLTICSFGPPVCSPPVTYTLLGCCDSIYTFEECGNASNKFIFSGLTSSLDIGDVYYITSTSFSGYASVIAFENSANIYDASSAVFSQELKCPSYSGITTGLTGWSYYNYCGDLIYGTDVGEYVCVDTSKEYSGISISTQICYGVCKRAATLQRCSDSSIFYGLVDEDTAFFGGVYVYSGDCYSFIEFSGPGGPDLGEPDYADCAFCTPIPSIPAITPSITPTITPTIPICNETQYCFRTNLNSISSYSGNYTSGGTYNSRIYYIGNGSSTGYVYFNNTEWCLSESLGGACLLKGSSPCVDPCPDLYGGFFYSGICITPTPTPTAYNTVDFNAIFECDFPPSPSIAPSITPTKTPSITPTLTPTSSPIVGVEFVIIPAEPNIPISPTQTPTITITKTVFFSGSVNFTLFERTFEPVASKVMRDCFTGENYYINQDIIYNSSGITLGQVAKVSLNSNTYCLEYIDNNSSISPNTYIDEVYQIYDNCLSCSFTPTPTPSITPTVTPSISSSITPTPSISSNMVYVFKSCEVIQGQTGVLYLTQTEPHLSGLTITNVVKDSNNNCWEYLGVYPSSYIAPFGATQISFFGDYFYGVSSPIFLNCNSCQI